MQQSIDRILTTHVGSLPRPAGVVDLLLKRERGEPYDAAAFDAAVAAAVAGAVARQVETGIDVVSDGEFGKAISWSQYALERLSGFERRPIAGGTNPFKRGADRERFAAFYAELDAHDGVSTTVEAVCVGPVSYTGQ
ncbi:MAG: epoxyalkane--coenzyme M transferase, partial [Rhodospirillaceae bacterium]|nr:epoxyalkane--coenzyme M transferase [Rhodospirillaceae bacterium]